MSISTEVKKFVSLEWGRSFEQLAKFDQNKFYRVVDCSKISDSYGMILLHDISIAVSPTVITTVYDSIACFLETITQCYFKGIYRIEPDESRVSQLVLHSDYRSEVKLSRGLNPRSAYWNCFEE